MWQSGVLLCIMPGMSMFLVQELNVRTVGFRYFSLRVFSIFHYLALTARGRFDYEVSCSGGVWLTQVPISQ